MVPCASAGPWKPLRKTLVRLLTASLAFSTFGVARADMIATEQVVNSTPQICIDSVKTSSRRSGVEHQLRSLGVGQKSAKERVAALTDEEVQAVVGKLDSLYAGGQYVPLAPGVVGAVGGGYSGAGAGYGGVGGPVAIIAIGLAAVLYSAPARTNAGKPYSMTSYSAPMDPKRKISEQDCTKPIVYDGHNLHCK